jgi:hypothetical protein
VDNAILSAASGDTYVNNGSFDSGTSTLTLNLTNGASDVNIDMTGAGGNTTGIAHTVANPNNPGEISGAVNRLPFHETSHSNATYPDISLDILLKKLNSSVGTLMGHNERIVFNATTSSGEDIINFDIGSVTNQLNPVITDDAEFLPYFVETNKLSLYVNGIKNVSSTRAFSDIVSIDGSLNEYDLWPGIKTGLTTSTTLTITVAGQYNGSLYSGSAVNISIAAVDAESMGDLVNLINEEADNNFYNAGSPANPDYAFGAILYNGAIRVYSGLAGTGSSVTLSGSLITNLVGAAGSPPGPIFTSSANNNVQTYTPTTYQYIEEGRPFGRSTTIKMLQLPPDGATVEIVKEPYVRNLI